MKEDTKKKKMTKTEFQKKTLKLILIAYIIVLALWAIINNYVKDDKTIYEKIGTYSLSSISIKDALNIKAYGIMQYAEYIKNGDIKGAYDNMLTEEYKRAFSYDEFSKSLEGIDFETFDMKQIKLKAEGTYVATVVFEKNGEKMETEYLLYLNKVNPKIITISPNKFIYTFSGSNFNMDGIELKIEKCNIYTDNIKMNAIIKNTSFFETMTFTNIGVGYGESLNKAQDIEFTLAPGEAKEIEIDYESNYYIPNNIKIKRKMNEETLRTYTFYFE